jgi:glucose-6-phosphate isomerase
MATATKTVTELPAWKALSAHFQKIDRLHLRELFAQDPKRGERLTVEAAGLYLDYSKNRISDETLALLLQLAGQSGLRARINAMFGGEKINVSEKRAVLHVALRAPKGQSILVDGEDVVPRSMRCLTGWRISPIAYAAAYGAGTRASQSATSSTSGLAAPTSGP